MRAPLATAVLAIASGCGFESAGTAGEDEFFGGRDAYVAVDSSGADTPVEPADSEQPDVLVEEGDSARADSAPVDSRPTDTSTCNEAACGVLPSTTTKRIALVDRSVACPAGFKSTDVLEAKDGNGCTCSCNLNAAPLCPGAGALATATTMGCAAAGPTLYSVGNNVCSTITGGAAIANGFQGSAPAAIGGACGPMPKSDSTAVTKQRRICEPNAGTCAAPICTGLPFLECIEHTGICPTSFPTAHTIGSSASVACPPCTCGMSATCTGTISFFGAACTGTATTFPIDGTCAMVTGGPGTYPNFKYVPNAATGAMCTASYAAAPGARTFAAQRNLCCR